ncbi:hypothetical protein [Stappia sp.]|uniref:hypothetical protein n=1 Tax=Stappia sp. TaxID=1870903 RepID=UPI003A98D791
MLLRYLARMPAILPALFVLALAAPGAAAQDLPPPWADDFASPTAFLACKGNPYALCYYSGPDQPTPRYGNVASPALPCTVSGNDAKAADCACYAITEKAIGPAEYNYVLIHSILNPQVRRETVEQCGELGRNCLNMVNQQKCAVLGNDPSCKPAPVCDYLGSIEKGTTQTLYPDQPETKLISTFSFVYSFNHPFASTDCPQSTGRYAGCMTAPCTTNDEGLTTCKCPIAEGPYQVGQDLSQFSGLGCDISPNVWSAANSLLSGRE